MNQENTCGQGLLPGLAPLANPYVPFQQQNPGKYEGRKALIRGTLFPGLDLPFMGMVNEKEKPVTPMTELQTLSFAIQELALYLDTHPRDPEALELYRSYQQLYRRGREVFVREYGPLNHSEAAEGPYQWLGSPWPWEYNGNKEG